MTTLEEVYSEWQNNLKFREALKKNPEQALKEAGFELSVQDFEKILRVINLDKSNDEELDDRISK